MPAFIDMDENITIRDQIQDNGGPVVLINTFTVSLGGDGGTRKCLGADAVWMKRQPGFISTQLHHDVAGSTVFLNYAVWESTAHFRSALTNPEFQAKLATYPPRTGATPHLFRKVAVRNTVLARAVLPGPSASTTRTASRPM